MRHEDISNLNRRFVKDFSLQINPEIAKTEHFYDRLEQYELYRPGTIESYRKFMAEVSKFDTAEDYYNVRNNVIKNVIDEQEKLQKEFSFSHTNLSEYKIKERNISSRPVYNETRIGKSLISIDLKSANFQALRYFNKDIVRGCKTYEEYISLFTDMEHIINSKYLRSTIFGRTCVKNIYRVERFLTDKVLSIILNYLEPEKVLSFNSDEVVFEDCENTEDIIRDIKKLSEDIDVIFHYERFEIFKIADDIDGFIKCVKDLDTMKYKNKLVCIDSLYVPFAIADIYESEVKNSFRYFVKDGLLCSFVELPDFIKMK